MATPMVAARAAAIVTTVLFCVACGGRHESKDTATSGATGTSGRSGRTMVASVVDAAEPPIFVGRDREGLRLWDLTKQFYQKRGGTTAWIDEGKPTKQMDELIGVLQGVDRDGIDPALYSASALHARRLDAGRGVFTTKGFEPGEAATLDVWLTYLYLQYASDITNGIAGLSHADPQWRLRDKKLDPLERLATAIDDDEVAASLDELMPKHPQYLGLKKALATYRGIAANGGWPALPQMKLKPGQDDPAVPLLAKRLAITGDYSGSIDGRATAYGPELQEAVKRFQRRHGLEPDAVVGTAAIAQMNVPVDDRIRQIALNLERWRWMPDTLGDRFILVNIPEYRLEVWEQDRVPLSMRVVVGKKDTPTPIFADVMTYIVFAPYWNVPPEIARNETVPSALNDAAFLDRTNMEVLDKSGNPVDPSSIDLENIGQYRFRQRPGASNSLGLVKFMFPNQFNVYLHDTPADSLFARATRSLSHGCVRLEQPEKLAQYVLADQPDWTPDRIRAAMRSGQERSVKLTQPLPVYLGYWTARISADGLLQFRDDLYKIDARQMTLLAEALERLKTRAKAAAATLQAAPTAVAQKG
jgi:murein L,D-transpeptidase YcbB/YkuD